MDKNVVYIEQKVEDLSQIAAFAHLYRYGRPNTVLEFTALHFHTYCSMRHNP